MAGHETTVNLISNGALALLTHPEQLAALRADPTLMDNAIEEMLRYDGPVETPTYRFTTEPVTIGDTVVPGGGELVLVALADADRDPARFPTPDRFDITRDARGMWRSATASITAWVRRWPAWRRASPSAPSWTAAPT